MTRQPMVFPYEHMEIDTNEFDPTIHNKPLAVNEDVEGPSEDEEGPSEDEKGPSEDEEGLSEDEEERIYDIIWQNLPLYKGKFCRLRNTFRPDRFPPVMNIVSVTRSNGVEDNIPHYILSRRKCGRTYQYCVDWGMGTYHTWQTKYDLGVYDYLAFQFDKLSNT
jgi:hypothetical protein